MPLISPLSPLFLPCPSLPRKHTTLPRGKQKVNIPFLFSLPSFSYKNNIKIRMKTNSKTTRIPRFLPPQFRSTIQYTNLTFLLSHLFFPTTSFWIQYTSLPFLSFSFLLLNFAPLFSLTSTILSIQDQVY